MSPAYAGAGLGRRSSIRLRIFRNSSLGTATSGSRAVAGATGPVIKVSCPGLVSPAEPRGSVAEMLGAWLESALREPVGDVAGKTREPLTVGAHQRILADLPRLTVGDNAIEAVIDGEKIAAIGVIRAHRAGGGVADEHDVEVTDRIVDHGAAGELGERPPPSRAWMHCGRLSLVQVMQDFR